MPNTSLYEPVDTVNRTATLKSYYIQYLKTVRGSSDSTARHYLDALNNISRRLVAMQLVHSDIYEIIDLDHLKSVRDILFADLDFIELNRRGNQMYSAGLNNYIRFASGEDFSALFGRAEAMDIPLEPEEPVIIEQTVWRRSNILRLQTLISADFKCEIDGLHATFTAENTGKPYMESHHVIPMHQQPHFDHSLDVYANLICLCPVCHRKIHYGIRSERLNMLHGIYQDRAERLAKSGIYLSQSEFIDAADCLYQ